jgi:hypothetical protein
MFQYFGGVDVSEHFTGQFQAKQRISLDFPLGLDLPLVLLLRIDAECAQQNIDRQTWIRMACAEKVASQVSSGAGADKVETPPILKETMGVLQTMLAWMSSFDEIGAGS